MSFAAIMKLENRMVAMVDSKITEEENGIYEYGKKHMLYGNGIIMFLGDTNIIYETMRELRTPLKGRKIGYSDYIENMKNVYNGIFLSKAQESITKFNLTWDSFKRGEFPNNMKSEIASQLTKTEDEYNTELINISYDDDKEPQIVTMERPYGLMYHGAFYLSGSTDSAKKIFARQTSPNKTYIDVEFPEALLMMADAVEDVSDTAYVDKRFSYFEVTNSGAEEIKNNIIDAIQKVASEKKSREDKIKSIEEILKEYKK